MCKDLNITKPTLIIDKSKCLYNIKNMVSKAKRHQLQFRPHFKTHQSLEIGQWFKDYGVEKIAVSSLTMADYFSKEWNDITVAFPTNILEIETINSLASKITLNLTVENSESVLYLKKHLTHKVNIFIQIDVGYGRTGIAPYNIDDVNFLLEELDNSPLMKFVGFLSHSGHTYKCDSEECIKDTHSRSLKVINQLKSNYHSRYPNMIVSLGDTPSCSVSEDFSGINEIRPGNFVFYDLMQYQIGSNTIKDIAVAVACPIVAKHKNRSEVVIYGGGVHFSKDRLIENGITIYGKVVEKTKNGWSKILANTFVKSLSQEHGIIKVPIQDFDSYRIGDYVLILPVHSCMTVDLMKNYLTTEGQQISTLI
ncbi:alanine racemase [Winogradskyella sp.]|uniref:alanine racemase n=1 Tax=Winogradskyella sp. TaxID=1883156 RepID=UPI00262043C7|nr:alanine racemase [Winogradskyella sp.]